jgi:hypothetical protein
LRNNALKIFLIDKFNVNKIRQNLSRLANFLEDQASVNVQAFGMIGLQYQLPLRENLKYDIKSLHCPQKRNMILPVTSGNKEQITQIPNVFIDMSEYNKFFLHPRNGYSLYQTCV